MPNLRSTINYNASLHAVLVFQLIIGFPTNVNKAIYFVCIGALSPGVPDSFASNYTAAIRFLDDLEQLCTTLPAFNALRSCAAFASFTKRWKLSIYFSTRFQVKFTPVLVCQPIWMFFLKLGLGLRV